ncbi:MAG TPA: DUF1538 domain-containing protein [Sulfuricella sp.]|nr:DUF1538 domain-containing protein [Sulfuricella sp.]
MNKNIRYGDFLGAVRLKQRPLSFNTLTAHRPARPRLKLRLVDFHRLLFPYVGSRFLEQARAVVPLSLFMILFQSTVLRTPPDGYQTILPGLLGIMIGLMFFMEGVKKGLMPFSENIGYTLPGRSTITSIVFVAFLLGIGATMAEPAIGALKAVGSLTNAGRTPFLYQILHDRAPLLILAVALGVGSAVMVGILRFYYNWRLKTILFLTVPPCLILTAYLAGNPRLAPILGLAWDCGAITTGPVTVPLVLAMGIGISASTGREDNPLSGFGIVTLASIYPVLSVMLLGVMLDWGWLGETAHAVSQVAEQPAWHEMAIISDILNAMRAILPLTAFLWLVQRFMLKESPKNPAVLIYGITLTIIGMALFGIGLDFGLTALGSQAGEIFPAAFSKHAAVANSPLYPYWTGITLALLFAALLGFGATVAEPALNALGMTVQNLTDGALTKNLLIRTVAIGVGTGTAIGVAKILFDLSIENMLIPAYTLALVMTFLSSEEYVNLAWDSAGVTTGPVTVPLVLALGLGLGKAVGVEDGFGILAMSSVGPIISVLAVGLWVKKRAQTRQRSIMEAS